VRHIWFAALAGFVFATTDALAQDMYVRVVDVDDSLCVVTRSPEGQVMLFDAGDSGRWSLAASIATMSANSPPFSMITRSPRCSTLGSIKIIEA
jgi:cold shock CspA family protein